MGFITHELLAAHDALAASYPPTHVPTAAFVGMDRLAGYLPDTAGGPRGGGPGLLRITVGAALADDVRVGNSVKGIVVEVDAAFEPATTSVSSRRGRA